jgi:hypothetical protein
MSKRNGKQTNPVEDDQPDNGISLNSIEDIIQTTGVINQANEQATHLNAVDEDFIFPAVLYTIPLASFYICMDVLLHKQFGVPLELTPYTRYPSFSIVLFFLVCNSR